MTGIEVAAVGAGSALLVAALGYGAKTLLGHSSRISVVETLHKTVQSDVTEIKKDVKCIDQKLQRLIGFQDAQE